MRTNQLVAALVATLGLAHAAQANATIPVIDAVVVLDELDALVVMGEHLGGVPDDAGVSLGAEGEPGNITPHCQPEAGGRVLTCQFSEGLPPAGGYMLRLEGLSTPFATVEFPLTLGLRGPQGAPGETGAPGATGPVGAPGQPGLQGPRGPDGPVGPEGLTGPVGAQGQPGPAGEQGLQGPQGQAGETGPQGQQGAPGPMGAPGPVGPAGEVGPMGPQGFVGAQGAPGLPGPVGDTGPVGATGPAGPQGLQGDLGLPGLTGAPGATGPAGAQGPQGLAGPQGPQGATGPLGDAGLQGPTGDTGPAGFQGPAGPVGPAGPKGAAGGVGPTGPTGSIADAFGNHTGWAADGSGRECFIGEIILTAGGVANGMVADGRLLPISEWEHVFQLIGTTYGGDGQSTFAIPDLRSQTPNNHSYSMCVYGYWPHS